MNAIRLLSRSAISFALPSALIFAAGSAAAQEKPAEAPTGTADLAMPLGPIDLTVTQKPRRRCGSSGGSGEIIVCGADHGEDLKVPGSADEPGSHQSLYNGIPQAPSLSGLPDCSQRKCIGIGKAPPKIYIIDVKSLPEAPKGSDAEKVANGEISDR
jgi:hypothetical protein